jgi:uncharacterized membrane-anchored protein
MKRCFYAIVGLQILFLIGQAASDEWAIRRGQVVTLKVVPVDPRSLFMGNYMDLRYDISTIDLSTVAHDAPPGAFQEGDIVYVGLTPQKPWARAYAVRKTPPPREETTPYLRGRIWQIWTPSTGVTPLPGRPPVGPRSRKGPMIDIGYGLERYFIPEARQEDVGRLQWGRRGRAPQITAEISVTKNGQGFIRRVLADGKPLEF